MLLHIQKKKDSLFHKYGLFCIYIHISIAYLLMLIKEILNILFVRT